MTEQIAIEKKWAIKRSQVEKIVLTALTCAIDEGFKLEDHEVIWRGERGEYIASVLATWLEDEDGNAAVDRLVTLIIH